MTERHGHPSIDTPLVTRKSLPQNQRRQSIAPHTHTRHTLTAHTLAPTAKVCAATYVTTDINNQRLKYINDTVKMRTALVFVAILATAYAACDAPNGDCGEKGDCHPKCQWKCDSPVCNQVCEPICEQPRCSTRCQELGCSKQSSATSRNAKSAAQSSTARKACPKCDTVCKEPIRATPSAPTQRQSAKVYAKNHCATGSAIAQQTAKSHAALVCEKSPHCQPQPPKADCCACAKTEVKAEEPKKCCGCEAKKEASASGPAGSAVGCAAYNLQCLSKCKAEKDATACEANCAKLMDLCKQNGGK